MKILWKVDSNFRKNEFIETGRFISSTGYFEVDVLKLSKEIRIFVFDCWNKGRETEGFINLKTYYLDSGYILEKELVLVQNTMKLKQAEHELMEMKNSYNRCIASRR